MPCPTLPLFKPVSVFLEVRFGIFVSPFRSVSVNRDTDYKPFSFRLSAVKSTKFKTYSHHENKKTFKKKWFNNNCYIMKRELRRMDRRLKMISNNFELKVTFHKLKKEYNKMLKMTKNMFFTSIIEQLDTLKDQATLNDSASTMEDLLK